MSGQLSGSSKPLGEVFAFAGLWDEWTAELAAQIAEGSLVVQIGKVFRLDEIVETHRLMEDNKAGGRIVVLP